MRLKPLAYLAAAGAVAWRLSRTRAEAPRTTAAMRARYDRASAYYDAVAAAYRLFGSGRLHDRAVEALGLAPGDTAVDLGCGTGENLARLVHAVGPTGRVVGVDLSPGMLSRARHLTERRGWANVELVQSDVRAVAFPPGVGGVVSTFALGFVPDHGEALRRAFEALPPGGRVSVCGLRTPGDWPAWATRLVGWANGPFGALPDDVRPWQALFAHGRRVSYREVLFGAVYLAVAEAR